MTMRVFAADDGITSSSDDEIEDGCVDVKKSAQCARKSAAAAAATVALTAGVHEDLVDKAGEGEVEGR